ncbi:MAG: hypothetical protein WCL07_03055 [bacterium]
MKLRTSILATLEYSGHFSFPLKYKELFSRLINVKTNNKTLRTQAALMQSKGEIVLTNSYFHLPHKASLVTSRLSRSRSSFNKLIIANQYATQLSRLPGVMAIYLTGSLAVNNANVNDDIDFMIITQPGRLWLTRIITTIYCEFVRIRRRPQSSDNNNALCLNLYLTPDSFSIPHEKRSLYTAYELIQATPLYDPQNTHSGLLNSNLWLKSYLPNYVITSQQNHHIYKRSKNVFMRALEYIAYQLQYMYMSHKITNEFITHDAVFFHPNNPGSKILAKLKL